MGLWRNFLALPLDLVPLCEVLCTTSAAKTRSEKLLGNSVLERLRSCGSLICWVYTQTWLHGKMEGAVLRNLVVRLFYTYICSSLPLPPIVASYEPRAKVSGISEAPTVKNKNKKWPSSGMGRERKRANGKYRKAKYCRSSESLERRQPIFMASQMNAMRKSYRIRLYRTGVYSSNIIIVIKMLVRLVQPRICHQPKDIRVILFQIFITRIDLFRIFFGIFKFKKGDSQFSLFFTTYNINNF